MLAVFELTIDMTTSAAVPELWISYQVCYLVFICFEVVFMAGSALRHVTRGWPGDRLAVVFMAIDAIDGWLMIARVAAGSV